MRGARVCFFSLLLIFSLLFAGCWGMRETDEIAYVMVVGFDKGEKNNLLLTLSIANPRVAIGGGEGGGGGEETSREIVSVEDYGSPAMLDLLNTTIDRHIYLQQAKAYIFSEDLAREGLSQWLSPLMRFRETRGNSQVFICRGKARDLIQNSSPLLELNPAKQLELIRKMSEIHGLYPTIQLIDLYADTKSFSKEAVLPLAAVHEGEFESAKPGIADQYLAGEVPVAGKTKVQYTGAAVLREDKLVGFLDGHDTKYFMLLSGNSSAGVIGIKDPLDQSGIISMRIQQGQKPKYKVSIDENGGVTINIGLFLEPEILASTSANDFERTDLKAILEEAFSKQTEQACLDLIKLTQDEMNADIFGFGDKVKRKFLTMRAWEEYGWSGRYPDAQVNISVHSQIRRTGLLLKTIPPAKE